MQELNNTANSLYKVRTMGEALSDTFKFMRTHYIAIFVPLIIVVWPLRAAFSFFILRNMQSLASTGQVWSFLGYSVAFAIISVIFTRLLTMGIVVYMKMVNDNHEKPTLSQVINATLPKIPMALLIFIVAGFITLLGSICLIIPGIYFAIVFSLLLPVVMIENNSGFAAINKCIDLNKNKFWQTFGFMFIIGLISWAISATVTVPMTIFGLLKTVTGARTSNPFLGSNYGNVMTIPSMITELISTLISGFSTVAVTIWYFSLAEEKYGVLAEQVLDNLQNTTQSGNEGDF